MKSLFTEQELDNMLTERHGKEVMDKLKTARVAIAGLGGLGSHIGIFLARVGVGTFHLIDFDQVEGTNIHRQNYGLEDIGKNKTEALKEEILRINPYAAVITTNQKITRENIGEVFKEETHICEAFDRAEAKAMLIEELLTLRSDSVIVAGSGMAGISSGNQIVTTQKLKRLYLCGDEVNGVEECGSFFATRVAICAGHQAHMMLRLLLGKEDK
ncbi:sulfur carrier protein ThiS adenylyltransferase [Aequitasia blattaphilus]|uniref:Sulfur carrier protein ThiS adenylyltransferase ThiF n=1 Tax=Aequitasia blattaphilus TaxID=2949332 RepID=A0ABT1EBG6_9FIRM|nr:sulfur carrier protein ThiS adenylyltransferase ThiF [Aequitasia blattaphilus]MCP1102186.1 sulfur carrier protein ThiS adenylyltransferase ThiF [Aequitasia blattaphilus]MCR8614826.1 sulfur carrier protein ThiS adenylyltransferase ThiF [Aequitasia blattaphilus]